MKKDDKYIISNNIFRCRKEEAGKDSYILVKEYNKKFAINIAKEIFNSGNLPLPCIKYQTKSNYGVVEFHSEKLNNNFILIGDWISQNNKTISEKSLVLFLNTYFKNIVQIYKTGILFPAVSKNNLLIWFDKNQLFLKFIDCILLNKIKNQSLFSLIWCKNFLNGIDTFSEDAYFDLQKKSLYLLIINSFFKEPVFSNRFTEFFINTIQEGIHEESKGLKGLLNDMFLFDYFIYNEYWPVQDSYNKVTSHKTILLNYDKTKFIKWDFDLSKLKITYDYVLIKFNKLFFNNILINESSRALISYLSILLIVLIFSFLILSPTYFVKKSVIELSETSYRNASGNIHLLKGDNGKYGITDLNGNIIHDFIYDKIVVYDKTKYQNIGFIFYKDEKCGVLDLKGNTIIKDCNYCEFRGREHIYLSYKNKYNKVFTKIIDLNDYLYE